MKEYIELTRQEKRELKERLYDKLLFISEYHDDLSPRKKDSFKTLLGSYLYWADEYNDGYLPEIENENEDRFCYWLVQEHMSETDWELFKKTYDSPWS